MGEYRNIKTFCKRLRSKLFRRIFVVKKVKNTVPKTYVVSNLNGEETVRTFMKKNCKRQIKQSSKEGVTKYTLFYKQHCYKQHLAEISNK